MPANTTDLEKRLWDAADELRANSKLKSSEYSVPVLGLIFLRYADYRFTKAEQELKNKGSRRRGVSRADYQAKGVMYLPDVARFSGHKQVKMIESDLGLIPEGWLGKLEDALILQRGFDLPIKKRKQGNIPIYASTGITGTHNEAKIKAPGVVTGRSGSLGTVMYVDEDFWALNTTLWVREFRRATPIYAFYLLSSLRLEQYNSGAAVPSLNRNNVHGLPIVIPDSSILEQFNNYVEPLFKLKKSLQEKNDNLRKTRDLLLPKLISGQIDVENLDIDTGELAA